MSKKTRNHKKALLKRRAKAVASRVNAKEKMWKSVIDAYKGKGSLMPMPTLVDALSMRELDKVKSVQSGKKQLLNYFNKYIIQNSKEHKIGIDLPDSVVAYIIPLDFYIPLPEPYNAMSISVSDNKIDNAVCVTVVSDTAKIEDSAIKTSYLIGSVCSKDFGDGDKFSEEVLFSSFERVIVECNNVIAGFQTIPTRHNHYMHEITAQSCPSQVEAFIFNRSNKAVSFKEKVGINGNVLSEIFQARPLDVTELDQFRISHVNKTFTDDKIFNLIAKYCEATNTRCFGHNEEAIVLADNFAELAMGYLYCEARAANGEDHKIILSEYAAMKTTGELVSAYAVFFGLTNKQFRKNIGFDDWYKFCRDARNDLTHRFMTEPPSPEESLDALHHSGLIIGRICALLSKKFSSGSYVELQDKLSLLSSVSYMVDELHKGSTQVKRRF